jgi:hypothetical protein
MYAQPGIADCLPRALLSWAPVDVSPGRRRLVGIAGRAGFRCGTLTSGIRAEGQHKGVGPNV